MIGDFPLCHESKYVHFANLIRFNLFFVLHTKIKLCLVLFQKVNLYTKLFFKAQNWEQLSKTNDWSKCPNAFKSLKQEFAWKTCPESNWSKEPNTF